MPTCKSCGGVYYFLINERGNEIAVDEKSITVYEFSGLVGKQKVLFNPKHHTIHFHTCKRNLEVSKRIKKVTPLKPDQFNFKEGDNEQY